MQLKIKKLYHKAIIPKYQTAGAACFDLHSMDSAVIMPGEAETFSTGLAVEIPAGYVMLVYSRSGSGFKNGIRLCNSVGVIDSDYRGCVGIRLHNDGTAVFLVEAGDRVAQAMIVQAPTVELVEVDELSDTDRGAGGFGSTNK